VKLKETEASRLSGPTEDATATMLDTDEHVIVSPNEDCPLAQIVERLLDLSKESPLKFSL
jgi:hypothetical protein